MPKAVSILVTGVGGRSVGHQVLQAVALAGDRYIPIATDAMSFSYGLYSCQRRYTLPPANSPAYLDDVRRLVVRENITAILPGSQPETEVLAEHANEIRNGCRVIANPPSVVKLCKNKKVLQDWLEAHDVAVPRAATSAEWRSLAEECRYPLVVKPTEDTGGSRGVAILKDENEVQAYLSKTPPNSVIFQEYVGDADSEYTVGVMVSKSGQIIDSIVMHRNLVGLGLGAKRVIDGKTFAISTGYSQGFIVKHPQIQSACEELAFMLGARGPLNIQLRLSRGKVVVFEVHPRFSGTSWIRAQVGFNEADTLIRNFVFGEEFGRLNYRTDVAAIRAFSSVIVPMSEMEAVPRG